ncbi:MAG: TetR/AcrR family transcriptional regulator [Clostridiales bacterium]|nr:TetR/AcrR family transcriptional regulator [Clostridiales bacterium]
MANKRFYKLDPIKQETILETALLEFMDKNFETASINRISKEAGLSAGALYYYFDDKEELFLNTIDYALKEINFEEEALQTLFESLGYWEGIAEVVRRRLSSAILFPEKVSFIQRIIFTKDSVENKVKNKVLHAFKWLFDYGYDNGHINNALPRALMFEIHLGLITSINKWEMERSKEKDNAYIDDDLVNKYVTLIKKAIGAE